MKAEFNICLSRAVLAVASVVWLAGSAVAADLEIVKLTGISGTDRRGPQIGGNVQFRNANGINTFAIGQDGAVTFRGVLEGSNVSSANDFITYIGTPENLVQDLRESGPAPADVFPGLTVSGAPSLNYQVGSHSVMNIIVAGPGVTGNNDSKVILKLNGQTTILTEGSPAPGLESLGDDQPIISNYFSVGLNKNGNTAALTSFLGGAAFAGIYTDLNTSHKLVATPNNPAYGPGLGAGSTFTNLLINWAQTDNGEIIFDAEVAGTGIDSSNDQGLFRYNGTSVGPLLREGSAGAVFPGAVISKPGMLAMNGKGEVLSSTVRSGGGYAEGNDSVLLVASAGAVRIIAEEGDTFTLPGDPTLRTMTNLITNGGSSYRLNTSGEVTFSAEVESASNRVLFYASDAGAIIPLAAVGQAVPGLDGVTYASTSTALLNNNGVALFQGQLAGLGVTSNNDFGIFAFTEELGVQLVLREGDMINVGIDGNIDMRQIGSIATIAETNLAIYSNRNGVFNDRNEMALRLTLTDGANGLFILNVPEPSAAVLGLLAGAAFLRRRS